MLCPEVWNFEPPPVDFRVEIGNFEDRSANVNIENFHFNHSVAITVPGSLKLPKILSDILTEDTDYYKVQDFDLSEIVEEKFLKAFVKEGNLIGLSVNRNIDTQNCFCITSDKKLILSLVKEVYQSLGIDGEVSYFCKRNNFKYIIKIPLLKLNENTSFEKRLKSSLSKLRFDVILNWEPPNETICPSSIAKYLQDLNYKVKSCFIQEKSHFLSPKVPEIDFKTCDAHQALDYCEWLGMIALECDLDGKPNDYVNTYEVPEPAKNLGPVKFIKWEGFFAQKKMREFLNALRDYKRKEGSIPWISLHISGFKDSIIAWGNFEKRFFADSEDSYTYFIKEPEYLCCALKSGMKQFKNKK